MKTCALHAVRAGFQRLLAIAAMLLALGGAALAQETIGAFTLFSDVEEAIALTGELTETSPSDFRQALAQRPNASMLILASKGGSVSAAITIADAVNLRGMTTSVPAGFACQAACAIVLFAGKVRLVEGELGVNQMAGASPTEITSAMTALSNYGVHRDAFMKVFGTPADSVYVFTEQQLRDLGIVTTASTGPDITPPVDPNAGNTDGGFDTANNSNGTPKNNGRVITPDPPVQQFPRIATYEGLDFYGADIRPFRNASSPIACQRLCQANGDCVAFTFNREDRFADKVNCFLKYGYDTPTAYPDAFSGIVLGPSEPVPDFSGYWLDSQNPEKRTIYRDANISVVTARDASACMVECTGNSACMAFSYNTSSKSCQLKGSSNQRASGGASWVSGAKQYFDFSASAVIEIRD